MSIWNASLIQRLEFQTNKKRSFEVGNPKHCIDDSFTLTQVDGKILAFKSVLDSYFTYLEVYQVQDFELKANSLEIFGIK